MKKTSCWYSCRHTSIVGALILLSTFLLVSEVHAAVAFAQQKANAFGSVSSANISFGSATTAGDLVIVGIYFGPSSSIVSVTDSQANLYTQIGTALSSPTNKQRSALFYAKNIKGGSDTVTVLLNAVPQSPGLGIYIFEYKGVDTVSPLDGNAQAAGSSSSVSSGNLTTTVSGDLLFGFCVSDSTCSRGSGFTARSTSEGNLGEDKTLTAAGTTSAIATANAPWTMITAAFKPPSSDTTPPSVPTGLIATPASTSQINLSWTASTDPDSPVAGYRIYRNNTQIGTATGTSYSDTGLAANTTYSYTVSAYDPAGNVSAQSAAVSATTLDTTPPSVPAGLTATPASTSQINLSWNASTDPDSPVAGYRIYRNNTQVGSGTGTSYSDTGLTANTTYSYTVSAYDPAGNVSAQSAAVSATTLDTTPPSVPTGLTATPVSTSQINLSWTASSDPDSPVAGYRIYRNNTQVGTATGTTYSDTGLAANTSYFYTVSAYDPAGNISAQSAAVSATTLADTTPPSVPTGLTATPVSTSQINLSWTASTDPDSPVAGYRIYRNNTQVGTATGTTYSDTSLAANTSYSYTVSAYDPVGNISAQSAAVSATTLDTTPPSVPTGLMATPASTSQINLSWTASTDPDSSVAGYRIYRNNTQVGTATGTTYSDTGLAANTSYSYTVSAYDPAGNISAQSAAVSAATLADTTPPSVPTGLTATPASTSQINLSWTASTDPDSPVAGYNIYRNGTQVGTATGTTYSDTGLAANTSYSYTVSAYDPAGNVSAQSAAVSATTLADTTPPSVPTGLMATPASTSQINLSWTASTDPDSPVAGYKIYRNNMQVGTATGISYSDTGLIANTTYSYAVSAYDPAGNVSAQSASVSATTLADTTSPSVPTGLTATPISTSQINLSWTASTDPDSPVAGYRIYRNGTQVGIATGATYSDTGLAVNTTYSYTVNAYDPAGNVSAQSSVVSATTFNVSIPTAVQHIGSKVTAGNSIGGYTEYDIRFDAAVLSGNCIIVGVSWDTNGVTPTITDDKNNIYTAGPSTSDGHQAIGIWYLLNVINGPRLIRAMFSIPTPSISLIASEFYNIATTSVSDGTSGGTGAGGGSVATGAISTTADNDLIWQFGMQRGGVAITKWTPASNWTLICPDIQETGQAAQFVTQTSHGSITPTLTQFPATHAWITVAMAFKSALAGTAPSKTQMRIVQHTHTALDNSAPSGSQVETSVTGNLLVLTWIGYPDCIIGSITDSAGNTWRDVNPGSVPGSGTIAGVPQIWYAGNIAPVATLVITVNFTGPDAGSGSTIHLLDIVNAAASPLEKIATASGTNNTTTSTVGASITPGTNTRGLVIFNFAVAFNTVIASSPSTFFMSITNPEDEGSFVDNNNGGAVTYRTDASTIQNTWTHNVAPSDWAEVDASFIENPDSVPPTAPTNLIAAGSVGKATLSWAAATDNIGVVLYNIHRSTMSGFVPTAGTRIGQATSITYTDVVPAGTYYYLVTAQDGAGNIGPPSNEAGATVTPDNTPPTTPTNLVATPMSSSQISLAWTASMDDVTVAGYGVFRNGLQIATSTSTSYLDTGLSASTTYTYTVTAFDPSGNISSSSQAANATTLAAPPLPSGLIAAYTFGEGTGSTTADDSGNGNTGTLVNGPVWSTGKYGTALSYNGVNSYVSIRNTFDITAIPFTIAAWVNPTNYNGYRKIFSKRTNWAANAMRVDVTLSTGDGHIALEQPNSSVAFSYSPPLNTWTHIAVVASATGTSLYVNGSLIQSLGVFTLGTSATAQVRIGLAGDGQDPMLGLIDNLRIYNRALSQSEVQTDMNTPTK
jgi:chitodextrinase